MDKELYDKILTLMAIDVTYEKEYGSRYVKQEVFDELLVKANVLACNEDYIKERLKTIMNQLEKELIQ